MRRRRRTSGESGFALLSAVLAAAFLAAAAFLVGGLLVRSVQDQQGSEEGFRAVFLAQEKAEEVKSLPFEQAASEPEAEVPGWPGFRRSVLAEDVNPYTKRITVRVSYPVRGGSGGRGAQELVFERTADL